MHRLAANTLYPLRRRILIDSFDSLTNVPPGYGEAFLYDIAMIVHEQMLVGCSHPLVLTSR
jgi:hypothetical protein